MKKFLQRSLMWLVALVAMFAVSGNAWAQSDLLGNGTKVFSATGTLDGTYTTTYVDAQGSGMPMSKDGTSVLDVVSSAGVKVGVASVTLSNFDVTFTINGSTAQTDGAYNFTVPENYFSVYNFINGRTYGSSATKFTINLTGASGGGTGGGEVDPDPEQPSAQPLNVTFDFNKFSKGIQSPIDGVTCESDGEYNPVYGWQVKVGKYVTFTAPYGYLLSKIVLTDSNSKYSLAYSVSTGTYAKESEYTYSGEWFGPASSVTFTAIASARMTTATITLVADPNAKAIFADFTSAFPEDRTTVEELGSIVLGLPADVTLSPTSGAGTIIINGQEVSVTYLPSEAGLEVVLPSTIIEDGKYTIVIPRGLVTADDGSISPETTLHYTVASPWFELTAANFNPKPGDDITIDLSDPLNPETLRSFRISYPNLNAGTVSFRYKSAEGAWTNVYNAQLSDYGSGYYFLDFNSKRIEKPSTYTFDFPAEAFTTTSGKKSVAFQLVYEVGVKHFKYSVSLAAGADAIPADATITVAGKEYKNHDVINVTTALTENDVTNTNIDGFIFQNLEIRQPETVTIGNSTETYDGAVIVNYEKVVPRVEYTEITPASPFSLDGNLAFGSICIKFPEGFSTDYTVAPAGFSFTNPAGQQITLNQPYGFTAWEFDGYQAPNCDLYLNFPSQKTLGTYTLDIPADALTFRSGLKNKAIHYEWTLTAEFFEFERNYSETVKEFTGFTLQIPEGVTINECNVTKLQRVVGRDEETYEPTYEDVPVTTSLSGNAVTFTFKTPFKEKGDVSLVLPEGVITATDGRVNREWSISQSVDPTEYIDIVSTTPESYAIVDGPFTSIVLNLGSELDPAKVTFGKTIEINNTEVPVTATLSGTKVTLTFADDAIEYDSNNNNLWILEGFITTTDGAISRSENILNFWVNAPKTPLEFTGIQMGWDGEVVTTSGANVEQVGVLLVQFAENITLAAVADLNAVTVTDSNGKSCELYMYGDAPNITVQNGNQLFIWVNPQMTAAGTYTLHIPAGIVVGAESDLTNAEINFQFVIADINTFEPATSIKDGETVDALTELVLTAPAGVTFDHFTEYPANFFIVNTPNQRDGDDGKIFNQAIVAEDGKTATLRLNNYKVNGEYTIIVPKGYLRSTTPNEGNAEIVLLVTVDHQVLDWDANDNGIVEVYDVDAAVNAALERSYHMGASDEEDPAFKAVDRNNDGKITIGEITKLIQVLNNNAQAAE